MQAPVKNCPQCGHAAALTTSICPQCGHVYATLSGDPTYSMPPQMPSQAPQGEQAPPDRYDGSRPQAPSPYNAPPRARSSFGASPTAPPLTPSVARCSHCQNVLDLQSPFCRQCGADQRTLGHYVVSSPAPTYAPPAYGAPTYAPPAYGASPAVAPYPTMHSPHLPYVRPPDDFEMFDLARQYQTSNKTFLWSLIIGLLLFWPLLILSYSEWKKMKEIKSRVALRGIDPEYWIRGL